jgi:hypothetical protein
MVTTGGEPVEAEYTNVMDLEQDRYRPVAKGLAHIYREWGVTVEVMRKAEGRLYRVLGYNVHSSAGILRGVGWSPTSSEYSRLPGGNYIAVLANIIETVKRNPPPA